VTVAALSNTDPHGVTREGRACPRIAVLFFGITRSLHRTLPSIEENILAPARARGEVRLFGHFCRIDRIENARSGESVDVAPDEHRLLTWDALDLEAPGPALAQWGFERIAAHGDVYEDGAASLRNLVHQLHSLHRVTHLAAPWAPDLWLFCRPDLRYHDSFGPALDRLLGRTGPLCCLPHWQWYFGFNDRFALIRGREAALAYGLRAERALDYCVDRQAPLHAEGLVRFALRGIPVRALPLRAVRVRATGLEAEEDYLFDWAWRIHRRIVLAGALPPTAKRGLHTIVNTLEAGVDLLRNGRRMTLPPGHRAPPAPAAPETEG